MIKSLPPETLAWLRQSAALDGAVVSQTLLHLLERVEALEDDVIEQSYSSRFCNEAIVRRLETLEAAENLRQQNEDAELATPTPKPAPVAMQRLVDAPMDARGYVDLRNPPPPAPAGELVERVAGSIWKTCDLEIEARAAIREVAAAARERIAPFDPSLKWSDFAHWLEQEANR
jgi:hypothetical protein